MLSRMIEKAVQFRNPRFQLDSHLTTMDLLAFGWQTSMALLRGQTLWFIGRNPKNMMCNGGTQMRYISRIRWGKYVKLGRDVQLQAMGKNGIVLGDKVSIGDYSKVVVSTTLNHIGEGIHIGDEVGIGEFAYLGGAGGLNIGPKTIIGQYFSCHPENHQFGDANRPIKDQGTSRKGIIIGANCWIGSKVTVLDGAQIGSGCVIAAGAVVKDVFPDNVVIGGVPAKIIKYRSSSEAAIENVDC